jgi:erythromycin esterase-like protein
MRVKSDIARRLIQTCGFTHVAFESQIYDFVDLQERYDQGIATREALYDAIGGLWSTTAEIDSLVELLHERALDKQIAVSGFDANVGGATGLYSQTELAMRLTRGLPASRQGFCSETIGRLTGWKFDAANLKDATFDELILGCARDAEASSATAINRDPALPALARSFRTYLEYSQSSSGDLRDRAMYENLEWAIGRLPPGTKTMVWTATSHGLRSPLNGRSSMASYASAETEESVKSIAVVALSGAIARGGPTSRGGQRAEIADADNDSLEGTFAPNDGEQLAYIDDERLRRAGSKKSRVLGYSQYVEAEWTKYVDGVVVMAAETPPTYIRAAAPMQAVTAAPER